MILKVFIWIIDLLLLCLSSYPDIFNYEQGIRHQSTIRLLNQQKLS